MADDNYPSEQALENDSEEALRQQQESQASEIAEETDEAAERLKAQEFTSRQAESVNGEQPFGSRKDETRLIDDSQASGVLQEGDEASDDGRRETPAADPVEEQQAPERAAAPEAGDPEELVQGRGTARVGTDGTQQPSGGRIADTDSPDEPGAPQTAGSVAALAPQSAPAAEAAAAVPEEEEIADNADAPSLSVEAAEGNEDTAISLNINAGLTDTDGSETLSITVSGVPDGVTLSAGTDLGDGTWQLSPADLEGLTLSLPENSNDDFSLTVTATSTETNGTTASVSSTLDVNVIGVADTPELTATLESGAEDGGVALNITGALTDTDGSETLTFVVSDLPDGATLSAGTDNGDGTWTLTPADLDGLTFNPPENYSGDITLSVTAVATENDGDVAETAVSTTATFTPVADAPEAAAEDVSGSEDSAIALNVAAELVDTSESLSITIDGVPDGATLSAGTDNGDGSWTLDPGDLATLTIIPPADFSGDIALEITGTATESDGTTATSSASFNVHVTGVADTPTLTASAVSGDEDTSVSLGIVSSLTDTDGSETLTVTVSGVPAGFTLSAGTDNGDGSWTLASGDLSGLTISPPEDYSGSFSLAVTAESAEADGDTATSTTILPVTFNAVADAPDLTAASASTLEDTTVALDIETAVTDDSESIVSVTISGVPDGATLSAGTDNGDGSWTLSTEDLNGLTLTPPADSNEDFTLTVTSRSQEPNGSTAETVTDLPVTITGVADAPTLDVDDVAGAEDTWIRLDVDTALSDTDSSETLHVEISGLPSGARLNVGTRQSDGTWVVDADDIDSIKVRPPYNYSGTFDLTVTAVSTENDGDTASVSTDISVDVDARADSARITAANVTADEDHDVEFDLSASVRDSSEEIQQTVITGVPEGFTVVGGTDLGNGRWEVSPDELGSLSLTPPEDYSGTVDLRLQVTTVEPENGHTRTTSKGFSATFTAVADDPEVSAANVDTLEDTAVQLDLSAQLTDLDMSETLGVVIEGVPAGARLSAGTNNGDGTWTVDPADLADLELRPPRNFSGDIDLTLTATATETSNSDTATSQATFRVHVTGVADEPTLATMDTLGDEDTEIPLVIRATTSDTDGSETVYVEFTDVPEGATFSAGFLAENGNWRVEAGDLATLSITPPEDSNADFTLTVRSLTVEADGDQEYSDPQTIDVTVRGVTDDPDMHISPAQGAEDTAISLNFSATSTDADGSETISYVVTGVPEGASLSSGSYIGNGRWSVSAEDMPDLTVTPPEDFSGTFNLGVTVVVQEDDGYQSSQTFTVPVEVTGVVDQPDRGGLDGERSYGSASGTEDTAIHLNVDPGLNDSDGSEETLWVEISNVPDGAVLAVDGVALSSNDGVYRIEPDQFSGLTITPAEDSGDDFNLNIRAAIQDGDDVAVSEGPLHVTVRADADAPTIDAGDIAGSEGQPIAADITAALTDTDGSESLNFVIAGLEGTTVIPSEGINLGDGSFLVTAEQLGRLSFSSGDIDQPVDVSVTVHAVATEGENNDQAVSADTFNISVEPASGDDGLGALPGEGIEAPQVTVTAPHGTEDQAFTVSIDADFDSDAGQTGIIISDLPAGSTLNMGFHNPVNDTWVISGDDADLSNLQITPPDDFSGDMTFTVTAAQSGADNSTQSGSTSVTAVIDPVVDTVSVSLGNASGTEDTPLDIDLNVHATDSDGSESVTSIIISGLPAGASIIGATDLGDGRYEVDPAQADQVQFMPPANAHGDFNFTVQATVTESDGSSATFTRGVGVSITAETDAADVGAQDAAGFEDTAIALDLTAGLTDADGSEVITVTIAGVPDDAAFSAGNNNGDGSWTFTPTELNGLTFTAPPNASGSYDMSLNAHTIEGSTGQMVTTSQGFTVDVAGVADEVPIDAQNTRGLEDTAIPIELDYTPVDTDGSETVSAVLTGIPEGSQLSSGELQEDGSWIVPGEDIATLTITPPEHFSGTINIHADINATEADGDTATASIDFSVSVTGVADAPNLAVDDAAGLEDTPIELDIQSSLVDTSEVLTVTIEGVPDGATLSAGTDNGDGSWSLTPDDLDGLTITPAHNDSTDFSLTVTATSADGGDRAHTSAVLTVDVTGVADTPILTVQDAAGSEDTAISLDINAALADASEALSVTISGVPAGATLSAGTDHGDGTWTVDPGDLEGLTITPAQDDSTDFSLTVTATSLDGLSTAQTSALLEVDVAGVADAPILTVQDAAGIEDSAISLDINAALTDASESLSVIIEGVPEGSILSAGTDNGDGSWTLTPDDLDGLTITPPADDAQDFDLTVTAVSTDGDSQATQTEIIPVTVEGQPDTPDFSIHDASGVQDEPVDLDIMAEAGAPGEDLSITISGLPEGASLSAGSDNGDGTWSLSQDDVDGLQVTPPSGFDGTFDLEVTLNVSQEGNTLSLSDSLSVTIDVPEPDAGSLSPYQDMLQDGGAPAAPGAASPQVLAYLSDLGFQGAPQDDQTPQALDNAFNLDGNGIPDSLDSSLHQDHPADDGGADAMAGDQFLPEPSADNPADSMDPSADASLYDGNNDL